MRPRVPFPALWGWRGQWCGHYHKRERERKILPGLPARKVTHLPTVQTPRLGVPGAGRARFNQPPSPCPLQSHLSKRSEQSPVLPWSDRVRAVENGAAWSPEKPLPVSETKQDGSNNFQTLIIGVFGPGLGMLLGKLEVLGLCSATLKATPGSTAPWSL